MEDIFFEGTWWRFTRYELRNGYIRPIPGAKLQRYYPLDDFQAIRATRKEQDTPHQSLLRMLEKLTLDAEGNLTKDGRARLLDWCAQYGLLGLLPHQIMEVTFPPRWERPLPMTPERVREAREILAPFVASPVGPMSKIAYRVPQPPERGIPLYVTQRFYRRTSYGAFQYGDHQYGAPILRGCAKRAGQLIREDLYPRFRSGVVMHDFETGNWKLASVADSWGHFFPTIPALKRASYRYPQLYSEEFWRMYAEPVAEFLSAARIFRTAFLSAAALRKDHLLDDIADDIQPSTRPLNRLSPLSGPVLLRRGHGMTQQLVSPSLLGSLVISAQADLGSDRRIVRCGNDKCRLVILAIGYQTTYCSAQCRYAAEKRAQRAKQRRHKTGGAGR